MPRDSRPCEMCNGDDTAGEILLCEECETPVHAHCAFFTSPVEGDWFCNECSEQEHNPTDEEAAPYVAAGG
jgi:hypothetical protein